MPEQSHNNFMGIMDAIAEERDSDPLLVQIMLTYEFDETQFMNFVSERNLMDEAGDDGSVALDFRRILPVVFFDSSKTREFLHLPPFCELHPWKPKPYASHHPKAYCMVTEDAVHLIIGSFNFTFSGLFRNREVFEYWRWDDNHRDEAHILRQWLAFLREHYHSRISWDKRTRMKEICDLLEAHVEKHAASHSADGAESALIHSGYGENGLAMLEKQWKIWFEEEAPDGLFAVSPFFDVEPHDSLAKAIRKRELFSGIKEITLVSSEQDATHPALCREHFDPDNGVVRSFLVASPVVEGEERKEIKAEHNVSDDMVLERRLHAKTLLLYKGNKGLSYMGSANFSKNAWLGKNQELGVARICHDIQALRREIMKGLGIRPEERFQTLPAAPDKGVLGDDEDPDDTSSAFPGFIEYVLLCPGSGEWDGKARFCFKHRKDESPNHDHALEWKRYSVDWSGETLDIHVDDGGDHVSKWLEKAVWQPHLANGKALHFSLKAPEFGEAWVPFRYDGDILDGSICHLPMTSMEYLFRLSNSKSTATAGIRSRKYVPGDEPPENLAYDREENAIIKMQLYLNLFAGMEESFAERIKMLQKNASDGDRDVFSNKLRAYVVQPLETLAAAIETEEARGGETSEACCFKLGELLLCVRRFMAKGEQYRPVLARLADRLSTRLAESRKRANEDSVLTAYVDFVCTGSMPNGEAANEIT